MNLKIVTIFVICIIINNAVSSARIYADDAEDESLEAVDKTATKRPYIPRLLTNIPKLGRGHCFDCDQKSEEVAKLASPKRITCSCCEHCKPEQKCLCKNCKPGQKCEHCTCKPGQKCKHYTKRKSNNAKTQ